MNDENKKKTTLWLHPDVIRRMDSWLEADNENRLRSLVFKWCVELNMALHMLAAHFGVPEGNLRELRVYAVDEVKRTNGQIKLDNAVKMQRRFRNDEWQE